MSKFGIGQAFRRLEDQRLLTGAGQFGDDLKRPDQLHLGLVRSPHAHAVIRGIGTTQATTMSGVRAVFTGQDLADAGVGAIPFLPFFKRPDGAPMSAPPRQLLARDRVRYVGEAVAAVVADSREAAEDAAEYVTVDYSELPAVTAATAAIADGAPELWPEAPGNIAARAHFGDKDSVAAAFARARHVVEIRLVSQRVVPSAIEPRAALAELEVGTGRVTLHTVTQNPTAVRMQLAQGVLKVDPESVRVVVADIGGGFGMKAHLYPEDALLAWIAIRLGCSVKWRADRAEEFLAGNHGRDQVSDAELALDADGRILALKVRTIANLGAYATPSGVMVPLMLGPKVITGTYAIPAIDLVVDSVLTNTASTAPYRGAGRPEAIYLIERLVDKAASQLGIDPAEFRQRNFVAPGSFPYRNATGETYDVGAFEQLLERALKESDWDNFATRRDASARRGRLRGRGLASYVEWTGAMQFSETVTVQIDGGGTVTLYSATQAMGQGLATSYAQILADVLEIDPSRMRIVQGDTDLVQGFGSMASRSLFVGGSAVLAGGRNILDHARELAADALEVATADVDYTDGRFTVVGTDRGIGLFELATRQADRRISVPTTNTVGGTSWPNGCHVCEVEIDPETGQIEVVDYTAVDDVGTVVNPLIVAGQIHGGIAQGLGQALLEHCVYEPVTGQLLTASFSDYALPRADNVPLFHTVTDESLPSTSNPLGAKGAGESGTIGALPAVMNAIMDALRPLGVDNLDMPATPERVWRAIRDAAGSHATSEA